LALPPRVIAPVCFSGPYADQPGFWPFDLGLGSLVTLVILLGSYVIVLPQSMWLAQSAIILKAILDFLQQYQIPDLDEAIKKKSFCTPPIIHQLMMVEGVPWIILLPLAFYSWFGEFGIVVLSWQKPLESQKKAKSKKS